jgi:hypothetical protein
MSAKLACWAASDAVVREEMADLDAEAARLAAAQYDAIDRKYHSARAMSSREGKMAYMEKLRRRRQEDEQA